MKKQLSIILLQIFIFSSLSFAQVNKPIDVMSFNIRYDNPEDGKQHWIIAEFYNSFVVIYKNKLIITV